MNIYDFDGTIYDGDSSIDFFKFCVKKDKTCLLILPKFFLTLIGYKLKIYDKEKLKSTFFSFVKKFNDLESLILEFWELNKKKIKKFYWENKKTDDIIISASPEFLLKPIVHQLGVKLIGTNVDVKTGKIIGKNCYGEVKVERLLEIGIDHCENFYSDSLSDTPCSLLAKQSFIVKGEKLIPWDKYKVNKKSR